MLLLNTKVGRSLRYNNTLKWVYFEFHLAGSRCVGMFELTVYVITTQRDRAFRSNPSRFEERDGISTTIPA